MFVSISQYIFLSLIFIQTFFQIELYTLHDKTTLHNSSDFKKSIRRGLSQQQERFLASDGKHSKAHLNHKLLVHLHPMYSTKTHQQSINQIHETPIQSTNHPFNEPIKKIVHPTPSPYSEQIKPKKDKVLGLISQPQTTDGSYLMTYESYTPLYSTHSKYNNELRAIGENNTITKGLLPILETELLEDDSITDTVKYDEAQQNDTEKTFLLQVDQEQFDTPLAYPVYGDGATLRPSKNIVAYCYPFTEDQIITKCSEAKTLNATGVYLPMMMEIQYKYHKLWYNQIKRLRGTSQLQIFGIAFGNPKWDLIVEILNENRGLFSGILIEWIDTEACITNIKLPTLEQLNKINEYTTDGIIRYFVRNQNFFVCGTSRDRPIFLIENYSSLKNLVDTKTLEESLETFKNKQKTGFYFPDFIQPVFACSSGQEGLCYRAFYTSPTNACSQKQRYLFNPYELSGGRLMHMLNETCAGLPSHDLYGVL